MDRALRTAPGGPRPYGRVVWVEPEDGARNVMRDALVLVRASTPIDPFCLTGIEVRDAEGRIPARLEISSDPCVVVWRPDRLLRAGAQHLVVVEGWRDGWGRRLPSFRSRFVSGPIPSGGVVE